MRSPSQRVRFMAASILAFWSAVSLAQSNSLLGRSPRPTPEADPATPPVVSQPTTLGPGVGARPPAAPRSGQPNEPPPNPVLLAVSPFAVDVPEPQRIEVHSLVTIIIRENRTSLTDAKLKSEKEWEIQAELAKWLRFDKHDRLVPQTFEARGKPGVDFSFENQYEGKGTYDRKDSLTTRLTATVIDVKPNGNLVLEARKRIKVGDEVLVATLTGECRAEDVTSANTVLSTQIADLEIEMPDMGAVRDATRRGWLMRMFDLLRPL